MSIRDIVEKILGNYNKASMAPEELQRDRDRITLARINGVPTSRYLLSEDRSMSIANYKYEYAPKDIRNMKMRLSSLPDEEYR
jgi:hypothetical protein